MKNHICPPDVPDPAVDSAREVEPMRATNQCRHRGAKRSAAPIPATGANVASPTYCRITELERLRGIKKGSAYNLIHAGSIESVSVPAAGTRRGLRLVFLPSVDRLLDRLRREQNPAPATS